MSSMSSLDQPNKSGKPNRPTGPSKTPESPDNQITELTKVESEAQNRNVNGIAGSAGDPFDPERLRLSQDFEADVGIKKVITTVPVHKPDRQSFFRVHPEESYRIDTAVLELKEESETYLVEPSLRSELQGEIIFKTLYTAITKQGVLLIVPVRLPGADGRIDPWNRSLREAMEMGMSQWIRVSAKKALGAYEVTVAVGNFGEPQWPDLSLREILRIAFRQHFIDSADHPVLKRLRGEL